MTTPDPHLARLRTITRHARSVERAEQTLAARRDARNIELRDALDHDVPLRAIARAAGMTPRGVRVATGTEHLTPRAPHARAWRGDHEPTDA